MPGVFISYRREDSGGYAGRLFDILSAEFGRDNIYMDLDTIEGGDDFASVIDQKISVSDVLVAVIGERWLTVSEQNGARRLDNPHDFVRIEIAQALQRGIRVIPVLVAGAAIPPAHDLPENLQAICQRQAVEIRDSHFHQDAEQLTHVLQANLHVIRSRSPKSKFKRFVPALLLGAAALLGAGILLLPRQRSAPPTNSQPHVEPIPPAAGPAPPVNSAQTGGDPVRTAPHSLADIAGKWSATVKYDWGDTYKEAFDFEIDGSELSGIAGLFGLGRTIREGKITEDRISFVTKTFSVVGTDQYEDTHTYKGAVENGAIRFTMLTDSGASEHTAIHFIAMRIKQK